MASLTEFFNNEPNEKLKGVTLESLVVAKPEGKEPCLAVLPSVVGGLLHSEHLCGDCVVFDCVACCVDFLCLHIDHSDSTSRAVRVSL